MSYSKIYPSAQLKPYVEFYYIWENKICLSNPIDVASPPNYCSVMLFNYGDPYQLFNSKCNGSFLPKTFIAGQSLSRFKLRLSNKVGMLGVVFKGGAFRDLFNLPNPLEYADDRIDLELLLGNQARFLTEKIAESTTNKEKVKVVEDFLIRKIRTLEPNGKTIDRAIEIVLVKKGFVRVDHLAQQLCMCPRNFRRRFMERMGGSPKYFIRVKRFNAVNLALNLNSKLSWRSFIHEGGYFDQSHLIKDYIEFTGEKPMQWQEGKEENTQKLILERK